MEGLLSFKAADHMAGRNSRSNGQPGCIWTVVVTPVPRVNDFRLRYGTMLTW